MTHSDIWEGFQLKNKLFKKSRDYYLLKDFEEVSFILLIYFQSLGIKCLQNMNIYEFCQIWDSNLGGEEETLLKTFTQRSLTKVHLSVIVLDMRM